MRPFVTLAALTLGSALPSQSLHVVDGSGRHSPLRSIQAAVQIARSNDVILVLPGIYQESVRIASKALTILGAGSDRRGVRIQSSTGPALVLRNHPAGGRSRFRFLTLQGLDQGLRIGVDASSGGGKLIFDHIHVIGLARLTNHRGSIAMQQGLLGGVHGSLSARNIEDLILDGCELLGGSGGPLVISQNCAIDNARVQVQNCRLRGSDSGSFLSLTLPATPAMQLSNCELRIAGFAADTIQGGQGRVSSYRQAPGAPGIQASNTRIQHSGVSIRGGYGQFLGAAPRFAPPIQGSGNTITQVTPATPVLTASASPQSAWPFAQGSQTLVTVHGQTGDNSITVVALGYAPQPISLGLLAVDLSRPYFSFVNSHDKRGQAGILLDLAELPLTAIGTEYVLQSLVFRRSGQLALSLPRVGVLGH